MRTHKLRRYGTLDFKKNTDDKMLLSLDPTMASELTDQKPDCVLNKPILFFLEFGS